MHQVLMIAYYFPPLGGSGIQRTLKYVKYLPEFGWQPLILTVKQRYNRVLDETMNEDISASLNVVRTPAMLLPEWLPWKLRRFVGRWILMIDQQIGWLPFAISAGRKVIGRGNIHAIYSSSAPYTDHLIAYYLKRRTGLPWIADFRDPWIGNFNNTFATRLHEKIAFQWERRICLTADRVVVVSEPMRQDLLARYPQLNPNSVFTIPNGYDPADFQNRAEVSPHHEKLVITYNGTFYGKQTPHFFLKALRQAIDDGRIQSRDVQVNFVGNTAKFVPPMIAQLGLESTVKIIGYLPHQDSIAHLLSSDILLLVIGVGPGSQGVFTGKIFEYLAAHKPILALVPQGVAADLVCQAKAGAVVDPEDVDEIARQLADWYVKWQQGNLEIQPDEKVIQQFDRRHLTSYLAILFNETLGGSTL